jgi:hypothetical protein
MVISEISSQHVISHDECPVLTDKTCRSPACQPHRRFTDVRERRQHERKSVWPLPTMKR